MLRQDAALDVVREPAAAERSILVAVREERNVDALSRSPSCSLARDRRERGDPRPADGGGGDGRGSSAPQRPARSVDESRRRSQNRRIHVQRARRRSRAARVRAGHRSAARRLRAHRGARGRRRHRSRPGTLRRRASHRARAPQALCRASIPRCSCRSEAPSTTRAAVEVAAWIARAGGVSLRSRRREGDPGLGKRDASRLLASAALLVQRAVMLDRAATVPRGLRGSSTPPPRRG